MEKLKRFYTDYREACVVAVGEIFVGAIMCGIYALIGAFDMSVVYGALLGSAVTVLNLFALSFLINRAVRKYMALRGEKEMTEEEAAAFSMEHGRSIQLAARGSYIVRTVMMVGSLALAFILSDLFDVVATLVPLLAYRPIIFVSEFIKMRSAAKGFKRFNFDGDEDIEVDDFEDITEDDETREVGELPEEGEVKQDG